MSVDGEPAEFVRLGLQGLYEQVRRPPYRALQAHADLAGLTLRISTVSDLLNGPGTPRWATVEAFVRACASYASAHDIDVPAGQLDVDGWHKRHSAAQERQETRPVRRRTTKPAPGAGRLIPRQLPADVHPFTGREAELSRLDRLLTRTGPGGGGAAPVLIAAISGIPGIGKTALAVHWAHRVADRFPDGQLYVNLRGFGPAEPVLDPAEALRGFLAALGVPANQIPSGLDALAGMYRSLLAGKRVLVVLDNARDAEQARALLPGTPPSVALVTSRNHLTSLVARDGAHPLTLDLLSPAEARALFDRRLGVRTKMAEPEAAERIVTACAALPLALAIAAARARQTGFPLATLAADLDNTARRLDTLDAGDATSQVHAVFSWSYTTLSPAARRLFRLLALHPGPDISAAAAASLAGQDPIAVRRQLAELARASLLDEHRPGRYACHDLLHAYALEQAHLTDPAPERAAAVHRAVSHYLHTAGVASRLLDPSRPGIEPAPAPPGVTPEPLSAFGDALSWFDAELEATTAAIKHAAATDLQVPAWQLVYALTPYLKRQGLWHAWLVVQRIGLAAARRLGDPAAVAQMLRCLAVVDTKLRRYRTAELHHRHALRLFRQLGDRDGEGNVQHSFAALWAAQGHFREALDHARQMLEVHQTTGRLAWQADALNVIGACHAGLGEYATGLPYAERAVQMHGRAGDRFGQAASWDTLGELHHGLGRYPEAVACYRKALDIYPHIGERYYEAETLIRLGETHRSSGHREAARSAWQRAREILDQLDHPGRDALSERIAALG